MDETALEGCTDDDAPAVAASILALMAVATVLVAAPSSSFAWKWSDDTCTVSTSETFETITPEAYMMLDRSGSMNFCLDGTYSEDSDCSSSYYCCNDPDQKSRWQVATDAIDSTVNDVVNNNDPPPIEFGLGMFDDSAENFVSPGDYTDGPYQDISSAISDDYARGGGTRMDKGEKVSDNQLYKATDGAEKAGILITDGEPNPDTDVYAIEEACAHGPDMYAVGFGSDADQEFNNALAAAGGTGVCCTPGTTDCSKSSPNYVDICSLTRDELKSYSWGRDLECSGAYQVGTGTGLKSVINEVTGDLSCTVDASSIWDDKWGEEWYDCAPDYDCLELNVPGGLPSEANDDGSDRLYHKDSSHSANGWYWEWVDPKQQDQISLSDKACQHIKSLTDSSVDVTRACMCDDRSYDPTYQERTCDTTNPGICECQKGKASCTQGINQCDPYETKNVNNYNSNWDPSDDDDFVVGTHCHPDDINGKGGTKCTGCAASKNTKAPQCNPAKVEECREFIENSTATESCTVDGETGRCEVGTRYCQGNEWSGCERDFRAVPEICNGLDDDCDGDTDDIRQSWQGSGESPQDERPIERWSEDDYTESEDWDLEFSDLDTVYTSRACGGRSSCSCDLDNSATHGGTGSDREAEFRDMVDKTTADCICSE